jgi:diamine N-acetyltransferase
MTTITPAVEKDISKIRELAEKTWWPTYSSILSAEQIRYMLDTLYSEQAIKSAMTDHSQSFLILSDVAGEQGFASYGPHPSQSGIYKLHKLYILPGNQGKGYGKSLVEAVKEIAVGQGSSHLELNVNRYNPALTFYQKIGFHIIREEDIPIGPYWMNDYVMRLEL